MVLFIRLTVIIVVPVAVFRSTQMALCILYPQGTPIRDMYDFSYQWQEGIKDTIFGAISGPATIPSFEAYCGAEAWKLMPFALGATIATMLIGAMASRFASHTDEASVDFALWGGIGVCTAALAGAWLMAWHGDNLSVQSAGNCEKAILAILRYGLIGIPILYNVALGQARNALARHGSLDRILGVDGELGEQEPATAPRVGTFRVQ